MQVNDTKKISCSDIGYHGTPIDALTREELLEAFLELSQTVYDTAAEENNFNFFSPRRINKQ